MLGSIFAIFDGVSMGVTDFLLMCIFYFSQVNDPALQWSKGNVRNFVVDSDKAMNTVSMSTV